MGKEFYIDYSFQVFYRDSMLVLVFMILLLLVVMTLTDYVSFSIYEFGVDLIDLNL